MAEKTNGKRRVAYSLLGAFIVGAIGVGWYSTGTKKQAVEETAIVVDDSVKDVNAIPGQSKDPFHNELQKQANEENYQKSKEQGTNFVPKIVNNEVKKEEFEIPKIQEPEPPAPEPEPEPEPIKTPEPVFEPVQIEPQPTPPVEQQVKKEIRYEIVQPQAVVPQVDNELISTYEAEIDRLMKEWGEVKDNMLTENDAQKMSGKEATQAQASQSQSQMESENVNDGPLFVRATTVVPGQLLTKINTDEPGPVMAEITTGPLKGARLLGEVTNAPTDVTSNVQKVTVVFNTLQMKGSGKAYDINVVAIDPETSGVGQASSVDNHYVRRYVFGTAAAVIEGLGNAFANASTTVTYTDQATIKSGAQDNKTIYRSALGNAGQKLGQELGKISDVPATIIVNAGTPLGLLFMADF